MIGVYEGRFKIDDQETEMYIDDQVRVFFRAVTSLVHSIYRFIQWLLLTCASSMGPWHGNLLQQGSFGFDEEGAIMIVHLLLATMLEIVARS